MPNVSPKRVDVPPSTLKGVHPRDPAAATHYYSSQGGTAIAVPRTKEGEYEIYYWRPEKQEYYLYDELAHLSQLGVVESKMSEPKNEAVAGLADFQSEIDSYISGLDPQGVYQTSFAAYNGMSYVRDEELDKEEVRSAVQRFLGGKPDDMVIQGVDGSGDLDKSFDFHIEVAYEGSGVGDDEGYFVIGIDPRFLRCDGCGDWRNASGRDPDIWKDFSSGETFCRTCHEANADYGRDEERELEDRDEGARNWNFLNPAVERSAFWSALKSQKTEGAVPTDGMVAGFLEAAIFSTTDQSDPDTGGDPLDQNYSITDFSDEAIAKASEVCSLFRQTAGDLLSDGPSRGSGQYSVDEQAGHDLWLTLAGHGAGFWDGDWDTEEDPGRGDKLTEIATNLRTSFDAESGPYVGDDEKLHF